MHLIATVFQLRSYFRTPSCFVVVVVFLSKSCAGGFFGFLVSCMRMTFVFEVVDIFDGGFLLPVLLGFQWVLSDFNGFAHFHGFLQRAFWTK